MEKIVIIGGGFGGLAVGLLLQHRGYSTTIIEAQNRLGGVARGIHHNGIIFDSGPVVITLPELMEEIYAELGLDFYKEIKTINPPGYSELVFDNIRLNFYDEKNKLREEVERIRPDQMDKFDTFLEKLKSLYDILFDQEDEDFTITKWRMLKKAPTLLKHQIFKSSQWLSNKYFQDELMRVIFSYKVLAVGNPMTTNMLYTALVYSLNDRGVFIKGGMYKVIENMERHYRRLGGVIILGTRVEDILKNASKVTGVRLSARSINSDIIISNADSVHVSNMVRSGKKDGRRYSHSFFITYFISNREYPDTAHQTHIFSGSYSNLLNEIKKNNNNRPPKDLVLYLYSPKRVDPEMAPEGKDMFYVASAVPNNKSNIDWEKEKGKYEERILQFLNDGVLPDVLDHIEYKYTITPDDFENELFIHQGGVFSLEPSILQSGPFREKDEGIEGLYCVGGGTATGGGIVGVLLSAINVADKITGSVTS